jgi:hypothetical protein
MTRAGTQRTGNDKGKRLAAFEVFTKPAGAHHQCRCVTVTLSF